MLMIVNAAYLRQACQYGKQSSRHSVTPCSSRMLSVGSVPPLLLLRLVLRGLIKLSMGDMRGKPIRLCRWPWTGGGYGQAGTVSLAPAADAGDARPVCLDRGQSQHGHERLPQQQEGGRALHGHRRYPHCIDQHGTTCTSTSPFSHQRHSTTPFAIERVWQLPPSEACGEADAPIRGRRRPGRKAR